MVDYQFKERTTIWNVQIKYDTDLLCFYYCNNKVYTCIFNMQLVIDEELLTFESEEQAPNSIDSLKYVLHYSRNSRGRLLIY
jgi:hypothetical protein